MVSEDASANMHGYPTHYPTPDARVAPRSEGRVHQGTPGAAAGYPTGYGGAAPDPRDQRYGSPALSRAETSVPSFPGVPMPGQEGLDLSFGYTPMQFEKINLLGSGLSEHAILSLVLSVPNITYLDLRGNGLDANFGWKLVRAMKKRYLQLEYCNGVRLRKLRDNQVETLNLSSFKGNQSGMFGIEVVGAIFLAHFLRLNSSLTSFCFRRNHVEKDGAKALAQSLITNAQCALRHVNYMGQPRCPGPERGGKNGIDFQAFRQGRITILNLKGRGLDDDDFVFLEEWLRKYDTVEEMDISDNKIFRDGIRKLARYMKDTRTLRKLTCTGLPVDLEGASLLARGLAENQTLQQAALSLGKCDENPERQQMLQQLGVGLARHPTLEFWGLSQGKCAEVRAQKIQVLSSRGLRDFGTWPRSEASAFLWMVAAIRPQALDTLEFGMKGKPLSSYPDVKVANSPAELWPALVSVVHEVRTLTSASISIAPGYGPLMMEMMRALAKCSHLRYLHLVGYGSAVMRDSQLPPEWHSAGGVPRWLLEDRVKKIKVQWLALHGMLGALPRLENFNDIPIGGGTSRDSLEQVTWLLLACLQGVAAEFVDSGKRMVARLTKDADVNAFCDILRLMSATPITIDLTFSAKESEVIKAQQQALAAPLCSVPAGEAPRFAHWVVLKNNLVSEALLHAMNRGCPLREFCYDNIQAVLPSLFQALCGDEQPTPVARIRIERKWMLKVNMMPKRYTDRQRRWLEAIKATLLRSEYFQEIVCNNMGGVKSKQDIAHMSIQEFAQLMAGYQVDDRTGQEFYAPQSQWVCFTSRKHLHANYHDSHNEHPAVFVALPADDETQSLRKISLSMCGMKHVLARTARPDGWPEPSEPLWRGPRRLVRPGDWHENESLPRGADDGDPQADDVHTRYHWRERLALGSTKVIDILSAHHDPHAHTFADRLLHAGLRSLFRDMPSLYSLDLRGNYLDKEDAKLILELLEESSNLEMLNGLPVRDTLSCDAIHCTGPDPDHGRRRGDEEEEEEEEEPEGEAYSREAFTHDFVRLDEGDAYLFYHLITAARFPELSKVTMEHQEIPDHSLPFICDALMALPRVSEFHLGSLKLSWRGASLLLSALAEMAPNIENLNGLPLSRLLRHRDSVDSQGLSLSGPIVWNDFSLGAMARLNLWQGADGPRTEMRVEGKTLTDLGVRGLSAALKHFATSDAGGTHLPVTKIDLAGNSQVTDAAIAELCHVLAQPALRHGLKELNLRSCSRLKACSADELLHLVEQAQGREPRIGSSGSYTSLGSHLQVISGVDVAALEASTRTGGTTQRATFPPMLLRTFIEFPGHRLRHRPEAAQFSQCDMHFFSGVLHEYPQIPHCHIHIIVPGDHRAAAHVPSVYRGDNALWGRQLGDSGSASHVREDDLRRNDSPFPPPEAVSDGQTTATQSHLSAVKRFIEAAPVATQIKVSMIPCVPGCEEILSHGEMSVLAVQHGSPGSSPSACFSKAQRVLKDKGLARRKRKAKEMGLSLSDLPQRALYVNNINSQRQSDCYRTLYGQDDLEIEHADIMPSQYSGLVKIPSDVDVKQLFTVATSLDYQHLDLRPVHFEGLDHVGDMPALTHLNLNHNALGDGGVELLLNGLVAAGPNIQHISISSNSIGDFGAATIAANLPHLPRLTSLELQDNFIQENGSIALAEAIGGALGQEFAGIDDSTVQTALPMLSVDLRGNRSRGLGAMRWAEMICKHPTLQFLSLAQNEIGIFSADSFFGLVYAAVSSECLYVLDLRENFPSGDKQGSISGPPPEGVIQSLLADFPPGEYDSQEVKQGVFIRRHRSTSEKRGRQSQQGHHHKEHHHHQRPPT